MPAPGAKDDESLLPAECEKLDERERKKIGGAPGLLAADAGRSGETGGELVVPCEGGKEGAVALC